MRPDAEILWSVASGLARAAAEVSHDAHPRALPPLLFFTDPERTPRPWETAAWLPAGAGVVFRHFGSATALADGRRLREATTAAGVRLLIGLDADLAEAVGADGVHLPERQLGEATRLREIHPDWLLTGAVHEPGAALAAAPLDAVVLSPVFQAGGASAARPPLGVSGFRSLAETLQRPAYALGGVDATNARDLIGCGACGLAGVSAIQAAFGPD